MNFYKSLSWVAVAILALDVASREPSPHEILERAETRNALRAAIATLSDGEQQVVVL